MTTNGPDALRLAREAHPDVVLLDILVPQLNGWEVCRRLKEDPDLAGIPVMMVTGRVEEGTRSWASSSAPTTTSPSRSRRAS